ncbi:fatty acid 2-hydroxylase [Aethina tumida]|uniref:fatty acid 2-hydroxylase n=1 Tax=Aethina tumida TaxID=116153 RepID=UPI002147A1CE|nr:fatty acid 2-hydroxylase [Aethina tumida]
MGVKKDFNVKYDSVDYNVYAFLNNHPGGINYVKPYKDKEISKRMKETHHSAAAYYLMQEYRKGGRNNLPENENLEKLVDWNKPMLSQVTGLGEKYKQWVISPVDRELRLFESNILEWLTITPWYVVPIVWIPIIIYLGHYGINVYQSHTNDYALLMPAILVTLGIIAWTLVEYSLHRWVFHMEPSGKHKATIFFHFAIHGLHHKVPFDSRRLVFPPFPAAVLAFLIYKLFSIVVPESSIILVMSGGLTGYVIYDMIHFYLHYGAPSEMSYFYQLKRYHNQHHFAHHDSGFGISSMFWDKVFGTAIKLRNLALGIKW